MADILHFESFDDYINGVSSDESLEFQNFKDIHVPDIKNGKVQVEPTPLKEEPPKEEPQKEEPQKEEPQKEEPPKEAVEEDAPKKKKKGAK